jgi:hypothetical protein
MSDILIKGIEMPKNCLECPLTWFDDDYDSVCPFTNVVALNIGRQDDCPLIELPPHGRLGDLDKLMTEFMDSDLDHLQRDDWKEVIQIVSDADVVIEAEGREE